MKTLASLGENAVVAAITEGLPTRPDVIAGAGDDCAILGRKRDEWWSLLKTDAMVGGIHFLPGENPARVGWKALCRAISDIAAMGGIPEHALVTIATRPDLTLEWLKELYAGISKAAKKFGVAIVGGETSSSPGPLFISIALTGKVERIRCVRRNGGRAGDALFVTGRLGGSIAGKHLDFIPRLAEARWLVEHFTPRAMMDLSDGLAADLPRLSVASKCCAEVWMNKLPCTPGCTRDQAMTDGEDYELLFSIPQRQADALTVAWKKKFPRVLLTEIGKLTATSPESASDYFDRSTPPAPSKPKTSGYDHFA